MKTAGIIGGVGPESTIEYYRQMIATYRERQKDSSYPSIIINSVDVSKLLGWMEANQLANVTAYLLDEIQRLACAGADFGAVAANTPHIVFDELRRRSPIPLISIVEATCAEARARGLQRVALIGTRFTMQGRFYAAVFSPAGIQIAVPNEEDQTYIHHIYTKELLHNIFLAPTRERLLAIVDQLKATENIEAVILGGTELPLLLKDQEHHGIPFLDTTRIHVGEIVAELLS